MKSIIVCYSYHHNNTEKIAKVIANVLKAEIKLPKEIKPSEIESYDMVGFGSGIDSDNLYKKINDFVDKLPQVTNKKAFIFSTSGMVGHTDNHKIVRSKLQSKGYDIVDEFSCKGFNTNSFLKFFGGMNKGRPNAEDLKDAEDFAQKLKQNLL